MAGRKEDALLAVDRVLGAFAQYAVGDATGDAAGDGAGLVGRLLCVGVSEARRRKYVIRPDKHQAGQRMESSNINGWGGIDWMASIIVGTL